MTELEAAYEEQIELLRQENALLKELLTFEKKLASDRRLRVTELEYYQHHYDLLFTQPWSFFFWKLKCWAFGEKY
jgi:hypothetical protein